MADDYATLAARVIELEEELQALARSRQVARSTVPIEIDDGEGGTTTIERPIASAIAVGVRASAAAAEAGALAGEAITSADGKSTIRHDFLAPSATDGFADGDTWFEHAASGETVAVYRFVGGQWLQSVIDGAALANLDLGTATVGFLDVANRIRANAITADLLAAEVGQDLVLSSNESIIALAGRADDIETDVQEQRRYLVLDGDGLTLGVPTTDGGDVGAQLHMDVDQISMLQGGQPVSWWSGQVMHVTRAEVAVINIGKHQFERDGTSGTIIRAL